MPRIEIYDTTLRDGSQGEGVNFSLQDKLQITRRLDALGLTLSKEGIRSPIRRTPNISRRSVILISVTSAWQLSE